MLYAVPVGARSPTAAWSKLDAAAAEKMPGVRAVYHREQHRQDLPLGPAAWIRARSSTSSARRSRTTSSATTASTSRWRWRTRSRRPRPPPTRCARPTPGEAERRYRPQAGRRARSRSPRRSASRDRLQSERGDAEAAFATAPVKLDQTYVTPTETHNPIELHATIAVWDGTSLTLYESSQAVVNLRDVLAQMLGVPKENVRVITRFLGSGFGGKLWPWTHCALAAAAARQLGKPVKLVVSRKMMFQTVGHRPRTQQRVRLGATPDGKLVSLQHDYVNHTRSSTTTRKTAARRRRSSTACPTCASTFGLRPPQHRHADRPCAAPARCPGCSRPNRRWTSWPISSRWTRSSSASSTSRRSTRGWACRSRRGTCVECFTTRRGEVRLGEAQPRGRLDEARRPDAGLGHGRVLRGSPDAFPPRRASNSATTARPASPAARRTSAPAPTPSSRSSSRRRPACRSTRSRWCSATRRCRQGPISGGSMATASVDSGRLRGGRQSVDRCSADHRDHDARIAVREAQARRPGVRRRPGLREGGRACQAGCRSPSCSSRANLRLVTGSGKSEGTFGDPKPKFSTHSFGCHFVEVTWQPEIARLRVSRVVTVIDAGRIINPLAGRNQIEGAVVMGIGMALFEDTSYDPQSGAPINSNLADYMVAVNADVPPIDVHFLDYPGQGDQRAGRTRHRRDRPGRHRRRHHGGGPPRHRRSRAGTSGQDRGSAGVARLSFGGTRRMRASACPASSFGAVARPGSSARATAL